MELLPATRFSCSFLIRLKVASIRGVHKLVKIKRISLLEILFLQTFISNKRNTTKTEIWSCLFFFIKVSRKDLKVISLTIKNWFCWIFYIIMDVTVKISEWSVHCKRQQSNFIFHAEWDTLNSLSQQYQSLFH